MLAVWLRQLRPGAAGAQALWRRDMGEDQVSKATAKLCQFKRINAPQMKQPWGQVIAICTVVVKL